MGSYFLFFLRSKISYQQEERRESVVVIPTLLLKKGSLVLTGYLLPVEKKEGKEKKFGVHAGEILMQVG